jgi:Zn-finger nucleic acid-binding protein
VAVHDCPSCKGIWFERNELERAKDNADRSVRWIDFDVFSGAEASGEHGQRACPVCGEKMAVLVYPDSHVKIDVCLTDHGVWLDAGEFRRIIKELDELTDRMSAKEYEHVAARELKEIVTGGHESRFSEIRDFLAVFRLLEMRLGLKHPQIAKTVTILGDTTPL